LKVPLPPSGMVIHNLEKRPPLRI